MSRKLFLVVTLSLLSASTTILPTPVRAETPLKFADIQALLRQVRLLPRNKPARPARVNERMLTGDALSTARSSKADLRFNDGSFARVGELALFRFIPNTRQFNLSNGTALLLIPPGRGTTTIKTPNVSAGIRGSALFVRVDEQTRTTIVGALTSSGITVTDNVTNRLVELQAGQMAVADPRGLRLFDFDLNTFYQTSSMVRGLNLEQKPSEVSSDKDIAAVQGETSEALGKQEKIPDEAIAKNLDFIKLSPQPSGFPGEKPATPLPNLPSVGKVSPDILDRGILGTSQPTLPNSKTPEVGQSLLPTTPPIPQDQPSPKGTPQPAPLLAPSLVPTPPGPQDQPSPKAIPLFPLPEGTPKPNPPFTPSPIPTPPTPGVGLTPIPKDPAALKEPIVPSATPPPVIPPTGTPPVQVIPAPVVSPTTPPVQVAPAPVVVPVNPPIQAPPPPVAPIGTPSAPLISAPLAAPVISQPLEVVPKAPAAIQPVPSPTPNAVPTVPTNTPSSSIVSPTPTLAPSLAPTIAPVLPLDGRSVPVQNQPATGGT